MSTITNSQVLTRGNETVRKQLGPVLAINKRNNKKISQPEDDIDHQSHKKCDDLRWSSKLVKFLSLLGEMERRFKREIKCC